MFILSLVILVVGIVFFLYLKHQQKQFGILQEEKLYVDTDARPGEILFAKSIPLSGKPDYLIKKDDTIIPVEVKTGRTPKNPYLNHTMQLMAYCFLVEETYGIRPPGGIIKYPHEEFKVAYTEEAERSIRTIVQELMEHKQSGKEFDCHHPEHN